MNRWTNPRHSRRACTCGPPPNGRESHLAHTVHCCAPQSFVVLPQCRLLGVMRGDDGVEHGFTAPALHGGTDHYAPVRGGYALLGLVWHEGVLRPTEGRDRGGSRARQGDEDACLARPLAQLPCRLGVRTCIEPVQPSRPRLRTRGWTKRSTPRKSPRKSLLKGISSDNLARTGIARRTGPPTMSQSLQAPGVKSLPWLSKREGLGPSLGGTTCQHVHHGVEGFGASVGRRGM